jgi:hypothetical protein
MNRRVTSRTLQVESRSRLCRGFTILSVTLGLVLGTSAFAQDKPAPKDDALDSLLEKLADPADRTDKPVEKPSATKKGEQDGKKAETKAKAKDSDGSKTAKPSVPPAAKGDKPAATKPGGSPTLTGKDQEVDELLQKLGETTETPAPDDRPRGGAGEKTEGTGPAKRPEKTERDRLTGKDKETDEHLEELTGRKRRKREDNEERSGPAGQIIKEMRDIEQKLGKPDTGEGTRQEQKQVVKRIETLIEEMKQSGQSSMRRMVLRMVRQPGRERGQQPGSTDGAMAQGAPATKPLKPTGKHANVGGKDIWGHLPPEMRQEINNVGDEQALSTKEELVQRYYTSVNKGKPLREESP